MKDFPKLIMETELENEHGEMSASFNDLSEESETSADESRVDESESEVETAGNVGWADAMSKVLHTTFKSPNFILSKARKDSDIKAKVAKELEVVDESGQPVQEKSLPTPEKRESYRDKRKEMLAKKKKKAEWEAMCRVKPSIIKKERERELIKIATRGVVHLFNTVEKHQKAIKSSKKDPKKLKKLNVMKGDFMDILKEYSKDKVESCPVVKRAKEEETWSILKDDFMMGAQMKDWDKESDQETTHGLNV